MNPWALLGIVFILYALAVFFIALKKPAKVWGIKKIQSFIKNLGERGTVIFFIVWGLLFLALGIWLLFK